MHWPGVVVCVDGRNFWLFLIVFVPINCFKLVFLWKAVMSCKLLNISLKLLLMVNMCQCLFIISFIFGSTGFYVTENGVESFWVYNVLKVMICLGGQLSQFVFLPSIHCSPLQQIFLLGLGNVSCIPRRLNLCA